MKIFESCFDDNGDLKVKTEVSFADWKESPYDVLVSVDNLLREHGLEIAMYDLESDTYAFSIGRVT